MKARRVMAVVALLSAGAQGCREAPIAPREADQTRVSRAWVTGEAAAALDGSTGLFRLESRPDHLSLAAAESLAVAVVRMIGSPNTVGNSRWVLERDRGTPIDFAHATPCNRALYAVSPYGEAPATAPNFLLRHLASSWSVPLCGRDRLTHLAVDIPDRPPVIRIVNGELEFPASGEGSNFFVNAMPVRFSTGLLLSPERAVAEVVLRTGRRVAQVPAALSLVLDEGRVRVVPSCVTWRVTLDEPAAARSVRTGETLLQRDFYVRRTPLCVSDDVRVYVAASEQPEGAWIGFPDFSESAGGSFRTDSVFVPFVEPVRFEEVMPALQARAPRRTAR